MSTPISAENFPIQPHNKASLGESGFFWFFWDTKNTFWWLFICANYRLIHHMRVTCNKRTYMRFRLPPLVSFAVFMRFRLTIILSMAARDLAAQTWDLTKVQYL